VVQELHAANPTSTKSARQLLRRKLMPQIKTWKTRPAYFVMLEVLTKKGDLTDDELFAQLKGEFDD